MRRHPSPAPGRPDTATPDDGPPASTPTPPDPTPRDGRIAATAPSLAGFGVAGFSRRRIAWVAGVGLAAWVVIAFAGQAASAATAGADVAAARERKAAAEAQTEALRRELQLVTEQRWVLQQARAYQLGSRKERSVALEPGAPTLPPDAPGSPARRLGAVEESRSPLEAWLEVLFGPSPDR